VARVPDRLENRRRELALAAGVDPDSRIEKPGSPRGMPAWCAFRDAARAEQWLQRRGVMLVGADLDESPMAYRRLPDVLAHHGASVRVLHTLRPFAVVMAGEGEYDPFKD
jgi:hypothetical protein